MNISFLFTTSVALTIVTVNFFRGSHESNNRRIEEISFYSASLQEDVTLLVYLPVNYTPLHKHTVVIAQDGRDYFQLGKAHRVIERLRETEEIDRTIIVGIPYKMYM